ncbi:MAG: hypothetical protein NZ927_04990 [Candidatus Calescibacterium sp.]|nr:hypothetical protein [Candidatus Calescibacterium sp.]MCX7733276.1 hypothetical protein [bacterium]MDW8087689.1 hypothetical protein [Candidatus Calescibacterium sp.]
MKHSILNLIPLSFYAFVSCMSDEGTKFYDFYHFQDRKGAEFPKLCVSTHTDIFSDEKLIKELDMMYEANFEVARADFIWSKIEPIDDVYDNYVVGRYENFVAELRKREIEVLPLVVFGNSWASEQSKSCYQECRGDGCSYCDKFVPDADKYSDFAKFVAQKFSPKFVEVWNEPNWIMFFNPVSPAKYYELLKKTYEKVKSVSSDIQVIFGGLLSADVQATREIFLKPDDFLTSYNFDSFDALAIHPYIGKRGVSYPPTLPPENSDKAYAPLPAILSRIKDITKEKPIWITEIGWPTYQDGVSELAQANYLIRALFISAMMGLEVFCAYELVDSSGSLFHPAENNFGIIRYDYSPKLSYRFLKFAGRFRNTKYQGSVKVEFPDSSSYIVFSPAFIDSSGILYVAVWAVDSQGNNLDKKIPVSVFVPRSKVRSIISFLGNEIPYKNNKNSIEIEIDSTPVVIELVS